MKQCYFQNNYGTVAQKKVSSCAPIFKFLYRPPEFFLRGKFIPKLAIFGYFGGRKNHIFKATKVKVSVVVGTWKTLPTPNLVKIA